MVQFDYFKAIFRHLNCFLSSTATDGKNGQRLKHEKMGKLFHVLMLCLQNHPNNYYGMVPDEICPIFFITLLAQLKYDAPRKEIQDSLGFWTPRRGFRIPGTGFQYLSVDIGIWIPIVSGIPDSLSCIPNSKTKDS